MTTLNAVIIGCGRIAAAHLEAINAVPGVRLAAVCDVDATAAGALTGGDAIAFPDHYAMLETVRPDIAIVCTPPVTHCPIVLHLLRHGVHVLCEKPLATSLGDAQRMARAAHEAGRMLWMASKFRFVEDICMAQRLVESGELGQITFLDITFCSPVAMAGRWNADPGIAGGGVVMDNGPHALDLARFLLGPLARIEAHHGRQPQKLAVEDTARLSFTSASGALGVAELSWSVPAASDTYLTIAGTSGALSVGWKQSWRRAPGTDGWTGFGHGYRKGEAFRQQLSHFAAAIRHEEKPLNSATEALACMAALTASYKAAASGRWQEVAWE